MALRTQFTLGVAAVLIGAFFSSPVLIQVARAQPAALISDPRGSAPQNVPTPAVIIEAVEAESAGQRSGIHPGDVFTSWVRSASPPENAPAASGALASPFDLDDVEIEHAPRGTVTLHGLRGDQRLAVAVAPGRWRLRTRPALTRRSFENYSKARDLATAGRFDEAVDTWRAAAKTAGDDTSAAWLLLQAAITLHDATKMDDAHAVAREALSSAERAANRAAIAGVQETQARIYDRQNDVSAADASYRAAIATRQGTGAPGLGTAKGLVDQASMRISRENLAAAQPLLREAVDIQRRLAPDSVDLGRSLTRLGNTMRARGDLDGAAPLLREGSAILERLVPDTADFAESLNNLSNLLFARGAVEQSGDLAARALPIFERVEPSGPGTAISVMGLAVAAYTQGRLADAEPYFRRALSLIQRLAPGTAREARALNNLGGLLKDRGDLLAAEDYLLRALAIHERVAPESMNVAQTLHNIGVIHIDRGDRISAEDYLKRSLELKERLVPGGLDSAVTLQALATLAIHRGDLEAAEELTQRSLAVMEREAPRSVGVAVVLANLGDVARDRGDLTAARERYEAARGVLEDAAPYGLDMAVVLDQLGELAQRRGESAEADQLSAKALTITERIAPDSMSHANVLNRIGRRARNRGELDRAATAFAQALDAMESQTRRLGGSDEARTAFASQQRPIYVEYADVLMALGQSARAFDVLERSRARGLLMMLAERDLVLDQDLSPELKQTARALREEDDRLQASLATLNPARDAAEIDRLHAQRRGLRGKRTQIVEQVRAASPRLAALQYPQALPLEAVQATLDPGTVVLSYQIGTDGSRLFVVRRTTDSRETLAVHTIAVSEAALREQVTAFRRQIERGADAGTGPAPAFLDVSRRLYDLLVAPAERTIAAADRVLIVPDGPLHSLPFSALVRQSGGSGARPWQYLVEWKPVHTTLSLTVYAELRKDTRVSSGPSTLVAFGDPVYPSGSSRAAAAFGPEVREVLRRGYALTPLPGTRAEVVALSRGFGQHATVYLGAEATEGRAKSIAKTKYLHFATHGLLDERSPLDSSLALSVPEDRRSGEENGLLQAWEIFEQLRIDADLVTLSGCETALGADVAGEGLIGLTRAFHYAGARTVLASLWRVGDDSTSGLMTTVYAHLRAGVTKDEALRRAQREAIAKPETAAPFHWAAFTLSGDWR